MSTLHLIKVAFSIIINHGCPLYQGEIVKFSDYQKTELGTEVEVESTFPNFSTSCCLISRWSPPFQRSSSLQLSAPGLPGSALPAAYHTSTGLASCTTVGPPPVPPMGPEVRMRGTGPLLPLPTAVFLDRTASTVASALSE